MDRICIEISKELKQKVKIKCSELGITLKEYITSLLENYLK